jgi:hypothetical protein
MAFRDDGERIYILWDRYARNRDVEGLLSLYAGDAILDTPLIPAILGVDRGVLQGHAALRHLFEEGGRRRPNELVRWHREKDRYFFRRREAHLGISARGARRRPGRPGGSDGPCRRDDPAPPHLLGLDRRRATGAECTFTAGAGTGAGRRGWSSGG